MKGYGCGILVIALLAGCGQPRSDFLQPQGEPVVWPAPPDPARVRYLDALVGGADIGVRKDAGQVWRELLYGPVPQRKLITPYAVAVDAGGQRVAVCDTNAHGVHLFDLQRCEYEFLSQCAGRMLESPAALCWSGGQLWVADAVAGAVAIYDMDKNNQRWLGEKLFERPTGLVFSPVNELIYVADAQRDCIQIFDRHGGHILTFGSPGGGPRQFNRPMHLACLPDGDLVVADTLNFRVQILGPDGQFKAQFGQKGDAPGDFALPKGLAVDSAGHIWVVDGHFENVQAFDRDGRLLMTLGGEGQGPGQFWLPAGACIDVRNRLWVADSYNRRVQVFQLLDAAAGGDSAAADAGVAVE